MDHAYLKEKRGAGLLKSILLSWLCSMLFAALLLLVGTAVLLRYGNPPSIFYALGMLFPALTAFFGGIVAGKKEGRQGALAGLLYGALLLLTLFALSLLLGEGDFSFAKTILSYTLLLLLSVLGGLLGASRKTKKRRHKRR